MRLTRRNLLRAAAACGCTSALQGLFGPTLSYAASSGSGGDGDNLIVVVLNGGHDGLFMFEPVNPLLRTALSARRPALLRNLSQITNFGDDTFGLDPNLGTNPVSSNSNITSVRDLLVRGEAKILSCFGHMQPDGQPINFRSHPQASNWLMAGADYSHGNQWGQRLMEAGGFTAYQSFRLGSSPGLPYFSGQGHKPPITLPAGLSEYDYDRDGMKAAANVLMDILNAEQSLPQTTDDIRLTLLGMHASVPVVKLIPPTPLSGTYPGGIGTLFADAAKILKRRALGRGSGSDPFHDSGKSLIQIGLDGFDMHSDVLYSLPNALSAINSCLTALRNDLEATPSGVSGKSVWDRTAIVFCAEFGRSLFAPGIGSEHGLGNISLVLGGSLTSSLDVVVGARPSFEELNLPDPNASLGDFRGLPVHNDYRDVFWEAVEWIGIDPAAVFPDFNRRVLNLFSSAPIS